MNVVDPDNFKSACVNNLFVEHMASKPNLVVSFHDTRNQLIWRYPQANPRRAEVGHSRPTADQS